VTEHALSRNPLRLGENRYFKSVDFCATNNDSLRSPLDHFTAPLGDARPLREAVTGASMPIGF
jgi:hypothetical protein